MREDGVKKREPKRREDKGMFVEKRFFSSSKESRECCHGGKGRPSSLFRYVA